MESAMPTFEAADFYNLEELLTADERRIRDAVRHWGRTRFLPVVAGNYRDGTFPHGVGAGNGLSWVSSVRALKATAVPDREVSPPG